MVLIFSLISFPVSANVAPQDARLEVGGYTPIRDGEIEGTLSGKGWRYEQGENTLYLDNYDGPYISAENMGNNFTINLSGNNIVRNFCKKVEGITDTSNWSSAQALYFLNTSVVFTGSGILSNGETADYKDMSNWGHAANEQCLIYSFNTTGDFHVTLSDHVTLKGTGYRTSITLDSYNYIGTLYVEKGAALEVETLPADYNESVGSVILADVIEVKGKLVAKRESVNDKYSVFSSSKYDDKGNSKQPALKLAGVVMGYGQSAKSMKIMTSQFKAVTANYIKIAPKSEVKAASASGKYKISYVLNGGKNNGDNPLKFNSGKKLKLSAPYRYGYDFAGWYSDKKLTKKLDSIPAKAKSDLTVYAKWKKTTVTGTPTIKDIQYNESTGGFDINWETVPGAQGYVIYSSSDKDYKIYDYQIARGSNQSELYNFAQTKQYFKITAFKKDSAGEIVKGKWSKSVYKDMSH